MTAHHMSAHHMTSHCITWHDTTQAITSHQITWAHITSHRIASRDLAQHKQSHRIKWHDHHIKWHDMHQNRSHPHHGAAEGSFTAKKWFGHCAGRWNCAHSIGKFFLCYIVLFSSETSAPGSPGNSLYIYIYLWFKSDITYLSKHYPPKWLQYTKWIHHVKHPLLFCVLFQHTYVLAVSKNPSFGGGAV